MPEILGAAGLATSLIGKWHLGSAPELRPNVRGFVHVYGFYAFHLHLLNTIDFILRIVTKLDFPDDGQTSFYSVFKLNLFI